MQKTSPRQSELLKSSPSKITLPEKTIAASDTCLFRFMRVGLLLFLFASISLALYSAFSPKTSHFSLPILDGNQTTFPSVVSAAAAEELPTNLSHILFGLGSSVAIWPSRSKYAETWWDQNTTRGNVWLDASPQEKNQNITDFPKTIPYRVSGQYPSPKSAVRISRIVVDAFNLGLPDVRWFVMGDDDTVFFADNLVSVLSKYDHRRMYYIGGNSESVEQNNVHAYDMAFGGGGFAISYPLAARLAGLMDGCLVRYDNMYGDAGDQIVWACVTELRVPLTLLRGFHQLDIRGNPYGYLAAHPLAPLVSLHHIEAVEPLIPTSTRLDSIKSLVHAYRVDPSRILQQSICYDRRHNWSLSISWGYTIQLYPFMMKALDLEIPLQTFKTWRTWSDGPFTFNTRPVIPDPCGRPIVYVLESVKDGKSGNTVTVTTYKRIVSMHTYSAGRDEGRCDRPNYAHAMSTKRIVVISRKMDPQYWTKEEAPRRQCSEIKSRGGLLGGTMMIRIWRCKPFESVTI